MRSAVFATRNTKELLRDPLSLVFMIALPLLLLFMLSAINGSAPAPVFAIESLTPGIVVFGLSFIALFTGMRLANDRESSFLARLFASPLTAADFILGYALPLLLVSLAQVIVCFVAAFFLGLPVTVTVLVSIASLFPIAVFFISLGLLLGSCLSTSQVGGVASIVTVGATILGGTWMNLSLLGPVCETIAYALPFSHAVDAGRAALAAQYGAMVQHLVWCGMYAVVFFALAIWVFRRRTRR